MKKHILSMSCAVGALLFSGGGAYAAAAAAAAPVAEANPSTTIGELVVTAERREENLQDTPIAVSAFSGDTLKAKRLDGGQNLLLQIPNANYSRTNFGGFDFKIRGIGTDVVAGGVVGTSGVSINENELPVSVNNFANTDFYDVQRVEVLRGPQGTLYGRNATGGAVDIITNLPTDDFSGYGTASYGNYNAIKFSGAVNIPIGDALALRVAGFRYVQDGFGQNTYLDRGVDGRDLGSIRATLRFRPSDRIDAYLLFEHYGEDDNRNRVGKQLCITDPGPTSVGGVPIAPAGGAVFGNYAAFLNQGCLPGSLYQNAAYGAVNSNATFLATGNLVGLNNGTNVFANNPFQDHNLHNIESIIQPSFKSQENLVDLHIAYKLTDNLTLTSITGFNQASGTSEEDYNRIVPTTPLTPVGNAFPQVIAFQAYVAGKITLPQFLAISNLPVTLFPNGVVPDPQIGPTNKFATFDYGTTASKEYTQEIRLASSYSGKFNFSGGLFYSEITSPPGSTNYYVFSNALTGAAIVNNALNSIFGPAGSILGGPIHIDPGTTPDGSGHNYYDSRSGGGFTKSYAGFGEVYYDIAPTLKLTLGGRYTVDQITNIAYPIEVLVAGASQTHLYPDGYGGFPTEFCGDPTTCLTNQKVTYREVTGRANLDWTPTLPFTDKTLIYATYSRGYKGGGFNTPCQVGGLGVAGGICPYPKSFTPEFINAYEVGTKNTVLGGRMTLNLDGFYYDYTGYQISTIVDKSSVNENINAKIYGVEFEDVWSPIADLTFNANIGYLHTRIDNGQSLVDQINLTQGNPNYTLLHEDDGTACLANTGLLAAYIAGGLPAPFLGTGGPAPNSLFPGLCEPANIVNGVNQGGLADANVNGVPVQLGGKQLPDSPSVTVSLGAQYVFHLPHDWNATLRGDYYWQDDSFARVFNAVNDKLQAYHVVNATLTFASAPGGLDLQLFVKNAFNAQPITGVYLTNDTSGLFQNVFTLDPRTYGVQLTKKF
ncbi:MAG: TonB-dependent receptor [Caulobacteraceae bacterium]